MQIVVHYAEIGLKGRNRPRFEACLRKNLARSLRPWVEPRIRNLYGRLLLDLDPAPPFERVQECLARVFGVAYFSRVTLCDSTVPSIEQAMRRYVESRSFQSFGLRVRRVDKTLPFTSSELTLQLGDQVRAWTGAQVNLSSPELWINVHVLSGQTLILHEKIPGPGGMPVRTAGRALSLISGGIDSPVASHQLLKRGCELSYLHFHSHPLTNRASQEKVRDLVARLARFQGPARLYLAPFAEAQQLLVRETPPDPRIVLYRRFMLRIAEVLARRQGALALVTGDSLGQVSSQTLGNLDTINRAATLPVLRPLIGLDKAEIIQMARKIGTYETSIEPDEDCCSYLMPNHPATWTRPDTLESIESGLDSKGIVESVLAGVQEERIEPLP